MPEQPRTIAEFGTRLRTTRLVEDRDGAVVEHLWLAPWPSILDSTGRDAARTLLADSALALPSCSEEGVRTYRVPGLLTMTTAVTRAPELASVLLEALGDVLATLRERSRARPDLVSALPAVPPPRVAKMVRTLRCSDASPDVAAFAEAARAALRPAGEAALGAQIDVLTGGRADDVLVHGELSLGNAFFDAQGRSLAIVGADGICHGHAACDVGWVLGELHELRVVHAPGSETLDADVLAGLEATFLRACRLEDHEARLARTLVATRLLVHAHDYAAYVAWHEDVVRLCAAAADVLTGEAAWP
jgi:aminoglycoside phosphotransferase (APT) family kinase protein